MLPAPATQKTPLFNPFKRVVSVEVELTVFNSVDTLPFQHIPKVYTERDGSVNQSGRELICTGLAGDGLIYGLSELAYRLEETKCAVDTSCGYHVHVDARDLSAAQIYNLLLLWNCFSPIAYRHIFPTRANNPMCMRLTTIQPWWPKLLSSLHDSLETSTSRHVLLAALYGVSFSTIPPPDIPRVLAEHKRRKYGQVNDATLVNFRYCDVNLHSWFYRGTIEFRAHHGTVNARELVGWPLMCLQLVHLAESLSPSAIKAMTPTTLFQACAAPVQGYLQACGFTPQEDHQ